MRKISNEDRAGLYLTVIIHLAVVIVLLASSLGYSLSKENSFVLDYSKYEEAEKMQQEIERLQKEAEFKESVSRRLQNLLAENGVPESNASAVRNVAVDRAALKDDRGTDAEQLYKDAERLQRELDRGYDAPSSEDEAVLNKPAKESRKASDAGSSYSGPSVVAYELEGRKASRLSIPAYRCMGAGRVTVNIVVNPAGTVLSAKVDESTSSTDGCLRSFAIRAARLSKFSAKADAAPKQSGSITYEFVAQ